MAVNPFAGFERSRSEEAELAEQVRVDLVAQLSKEKYQRHMVIEPVSYLDIDVTDSSGRYLRQFHVVDSLRISLPMSFKRRNVYGEITSGVKALAQKLADERGSAEIQFFYNPADVRVQKISLTGGVVPTAKNNPVSVVKEADSGTPRGAMRIVVKGGALPGRI